MCIDMLVVGWLTSSELFVYVLYRLTMVQQVNNHCYIGNHFDIHNTYGDKRVKIFSYF